MSARSRIERLEQRQGRWTAPYVVVQQESETLEAAKLRALNGHAAPPHWKFILAPEPMSERD